MAKYTMHNMEIQEDQHEEQKENTSDMKQLQRHNSTNLIGVRSPRKSMTVEKASFKMPEKEKIKVNSPS